MKKICKNIYKHNEKYIKNIIKRQRLSKSTKLSKCRFQGGDKDKVGPSEVKFVLVGWEWKKNIYHGSRG